MTSKLSKDPSTKVGSVIASFDNLQISTGYNGFPAGLDESPNKWERPIKYQYVIHSELNAIMHCPFDIHRVPSTLYVTHQPCHRCMGHIRNAGIKRIVYTNPYSNLEYPDIWNEIAQLFDEVQQMPIDSNL